MPSLAIRIATTGDIPLIISIQEKTWFPTYSSILKADQLIYMFEHSYSRQALEEQMTALGHIFFICFEETIPLGFASVSGANDIFCLHKIYIQPDGQGRGVGRVLLKTVEEACVKNGARTLRLNVNRYNKARMFYQKMGYEVIEEVDIPIGPYWMNDYVMEKRLSVQEKQS